MVPENKNHVVKHDKGDKYHDFYGGHAVISIGHSHPHYITCIKNQLDQIGFYSNSVKNPLQKRLAAKLGQLSNCENYNLFLCNSGAEANENALKLASFHTNKSRVIAFTNSFHGRTSAAVAATDNEKINAPINNLTLWRCVKQIIVFYLRRIFAECWVFNLICRTTISSMGSKKGRVYKTLPFHIIIGNFTFFQ